MAKKLENHLPEVFLSTTETTDRIRSWVKRGSARKVGPRLYTSNLTDQLEVVVRRNLWQIVGLLFPNSVIAHRTALEARPSADGIVFLAAPYTRTVTLPGLVIRLIKGPGRLPGDRPFIGDLWYASRERALLENLKPTRTRSTTARAVTRQEVEEYLDRLLRTSGEETLDQLRDNARAIAADLDAAKELQKLDDIIGTLLGTRQAPITAPTAVARTAGTPYDPDRLDTMQALFAELQRHAPHTRPNACTAGACATNLAFFDAYFSNYIEGTEFEVDEAKEIIFENRIPERRPADAHDILGTFRLLTDTRAMRESATSICQIPHDFLNLLQERHVAIIGARPEVRPGEFKAQPNFAGGTAFVSPELVYGTLEKGFELFRSLESPFARATFVMFLVTEVHPFDDGNGRVARIMMNVEFEAGGETHVLIPTVFRDDYLGALRAASRERYHKPLIQMLEYAQEFTSKVDFTDLQAAHAVLTACNAFEHHRSMRLLLPDLGRPDDGPAPGFSPGETRRPKTMD